jgi:hypothetical protein
MRLGRRLRRRVVMMVMMRVLMRMRMRMRVLMRVLLLVWVLLLLLGRLLLLLLRPRLGRRICRGRHATAQLPGRGQGRSAVVARVVTRGGDGLVKGGVGGPPVVEMGVVVGMRVRMRMMLLLGGWVVVMMMRRMRRVSKGRRLRRRPSREGRGRAGGGVVGVAGVVGEGRWRGRRSGLHVCSACSPMSFRPSSKIPFRMTKRSETKRDQAQRLSLSLLDRQTDRQPTG